MRLSAAEVSAAAQAATPRNPGCAPNATQAAPPRTQAAPPRTQAAPPRTQAAPPTQVSEAGALHKLLIEDDPSHAASYVWSVALRGYLSMLEGGDRNLVDHGDALPPALISSPPPRGSVAVEQVRGTCARAWYVHGTCTCTHGTCTWYMHMVHAHGTCTWCMHMVRAHGACTWYVHMVHAWYVHMVHAWYVHMVRAHGTRTRYVAHGTCRCAAARRG